LQAAMPPTPKQPCELPQAVRNQQNMYMALAKQRFEYRYSEEKYNYAA
jgi:hypothetical protein